MMKFARQFCMLLSCIAVSQALSAATFVVPSDREMIHKSDAIVVGEALTSYARLNDRGGIETVTPFSVSEVIKGSGLGMTVDLVEPGGTYNDMTTSIPGVPRFEAGKRMMLMLKSTGTDRWAATDLVLGKFTFATDRLGHNLLVRDEGEVVGWDAPAMTKHRETRRDAAKFLQFVRAEANGMATAIDYTVANAPLVQTTSSTLTPTTNIAPYSATSYTSACGSGGCRWNVFPSAVNFYRSVSGETGAQNNGDTAINAAMAAWDNDAQSNVNYVYAGVDNGTHTSGLNAPDGANTILFEQNLTGFGATAFTCTSNSYGGTLGIGGITSASGTHTGPNGETFGTTQEVDVMMNQGIANCTLLLSTNVGDFNSAVTHEVGHTLGWRHSDKNRADNGSCGTDAIQEECSSSAIMTASVTHGLNATLQTWDQHAVQAVYPCSLGGGCSTTAFVRGDFNGDGHPDLVWHNYTTGDVNVWFMNGTTYLGGTSLFTVADLNWHIEGVGDFNGDGKSDLVWRNYSTGAVNVWFMNGTTYLSGASLFTVSDLNWHIEAINDFNGDGHDDLVWRNYATGAVNIWFMNGTTYLGGANLFTVADANWHIVGAGDFNGDGNPDLVWRNQATGAVNVWFMNGTTYLSGTSLFTVADSNWQINAVGDYNNDGKPDLVWRNYSTGAVNVWFMNNTTYLGGTTLFTVADPNWKIEGPR